MGEGLTQTMKLSQLVVVLNDLEDHLTIFTVQEDIVSTDPDIVISEDEDAGFYFLEVGLAKSIISTWTAWRDGAVPTVAETCEALVYYSTNDAYMPIAE
jgi:hypothetical protein